MSVGISAQEKFQISATGGYLSVLKENVGDYTFSASYDFNSFARAGLEAMLSEKTAEFGTIQKYTLFVDLFLEKNSHFALSWGMGPAYLHSQDKFDGIGMDFRSKFYTNMFANLFLVVEMKNNISKHFNCMTQYNLGLMYRF